jgi:hypothetical protein
MQTTGFMKIEKLSHVVTAYDCKLKFPTYEVIPQLLD